MWHLYLDESGDLGFDFSEKKSSKFFTITILVLCGDIDNKALLQAAKRTVRKKLNPKNQNKIHELKGTNTKLEVKKYFYNQVKNIEFRIYSITLRKADIVGLVKDKEHLYNLVARQVIDKISVEEFNDNGIELVVDRSKGKLGISDFNVLIGSRLEEKIRSDIVINIHHLRSHENHGIQACDLFSYGIFLYREKGDNKWREIFADKIWCEEMYLNKEEVESLAGYDL